MNRRREQFSQVPCKKPPQSIVAFYLGERPDAEGRLIETIWAWGDDELEYVHDYIQWLFPLTEKSRFNDAAPIVDEETIEAFRTDSRLRERLIISLRLMLRFYGFQCEESDGGDISIIKSSAYPQRKQNWISRGNHNFLRLTRIVKSLRLLGLEDYAQAVFRCLSLIYAEERGRIGRDSFSFWERAASSSTGRA
jgi:hypothetical protein